MITTVLIDVDDTLLDFGECAKQSMQFAMRDAQLRFEDAYFPIFTEENKKLWLEIEAGSLTVPELYKKRWKIVFSRLGICYDGEAFERSFLQYLKQSAEPVRHALALLEYLHSKYTVCIASNAPFEQQMLRLTKAEMLPYIHHVFVSSELGYPKPLEGFFDVCFSRLPDARPSETIIIGDSLTSDIQGGIAYGLKTCWFNRHDCPIPQDMKIDYVVRSLDEIQRFS